MAPNDQWITVSEAVKLSGYHPDSLRELVRDGKIVGKKVSIVWLVDRDSLMAYLAKIEARGEKRGPKPQTQRNKKPKM
jgi:hypothetical protein